MKVPQLSVLILSGAVLASAHFELDSPPARGLDEDTLANAPCGGQQDPSATRFAVPLDDPELSLELTMGHDHSALQVLLGLGNDPGSNFNISVLPTMQQVGLGSLCLPHVSLSEEVLGVKPEDGMNATLQVVTNGDPTGGLYNCADITFSSTADFSVPDSCKNDTGISAEPFTGDAANRNANESTADGSPQQGGGGGGSGDHGDHQDRSATITVSWALLGAAVVGALAL